jgi:HlyD family secretion protein
VFTVVGGRSKFLPVKKGIMGELMIEITAGLTEGQEIVAGPYDALRQLKDDTLLKSDVKKGDVKK